MMPALRIARKAAESLSDSWTKIVLPLPEGRGKNESELGRKRSGKEKALDQNFAQLSTPHSHYHQNTHTLTYS